MTEPISQTQRSAWQLLCLLALGGIGYIGRRTLNLGSETLNRVSEGVYYLIPFFAVRPALRLRRWFRIVAMLALAPLLLLSSLVLLLEVIPGSERTEPLQTLQVGSSTLQLQRYENGGSVGVHGINLEQRRPIFPGLYIVKSIAFFYEADEGTVTPEGPYRVKVHARGSYHDANYEVEKVYSLKPWVYF
jgi:hypothetical protein